jgi:hypothetical protein
MAITIQELLASDTISQVVDKINFNFDQLLLNGGGPVGPAGPLGPPGPIGGRGERGSEWYEGTANPNVVPPTLTPLTADYYLQSNGDVWEFTGLTWSNTGINLVGPQGPAGASVGWSQFGNNPYPNYAATYQNVLYPAPITTGITVSNQGVAATLIGAVGPGDVSANPGIPFTPAFQLNNTMAGSIDASVVSMLVHQKDSSASAIKFMGGGAIAADNYEQSSIGELSSIGLGIDDSIVINVPKAVTGAIGSLQDTYGFNLYTLKKGQNFRAGRSISFTTGTLGSTLTGPLDVSDFTINLNVVNSTQLPKYEMNILGSKDASISAGNISIPAATTTKLGNIVLEGGSIFSVGKNVNNVYGGAVEVSSTASSIGMLSVSNIIISAADTVNIRGGGAIGSVAGYKVQMQSEGNTLIKENDQLLRIESVEDIQIAGEDVDIDVDNSITLTASNFITNSAGTDLNLYTQGTTSTIRLKKASGTGITNPEIRIVSTNATIGGWTGGYIGIRGAIGWTSTNSGIVGQPKSDGWWNLDSTSGSSPTKPIILGSNNSASSSIIFRAEGQGRKMDIKSDGFKSYDSTDYYVEADEDKMSVNVPFVYDEQYIAALVYNYTTATSWPNITINSSFITYYVGGTFGESPIPVGSSGYSYSATKSLPDGTYYGQRLTLRLVVLPFKMTFGGDPYEYTGTVNISANVTGTLPETIATASCTFSSGQEQLVDLVWTGRTLQSVWGPPGGFGPTTTWNMKGGWRKLSTVTTAAYT